MKSYLREQWDRVSAVVAVVAGAAMLVFGWFGVQGKVYPGQQIPFVVSGGIGGVFLLGVGAVLWLSADLRDEWRKLDDVDATLRRIEAAQAAGESVIKLLVDGDHDAGHESEALAGQGRRRR